MLSGCCLLQCLVGFSRLLWYMLCIEHYSSSQCLI
jgi:hypothetical protein